jgi:hypothetical protein
MKKFSPFNKPFDKPFDKLRVTFLKLTVSVRAAVPNVIFISTGSSNQVPYVSFTGFVQESLRSSCTLSICHPELVEICHPELVEGQFQYNC